MKAISTIIIIFFCLSGTWVSAQVGIGTTTPNSSAVLDLSSSSKGLLIPRMTSVQRIAIVSPSTGLLVFDNDSNSFFYYTGSVWKSISGSSSSSSYWGRSGSSTILANSGDNVGIGKTPKHGFDVNKGINTDSSYLIGGVQVLSTKGKSMLMLGQGAGKNDSTGEQNVLIGDSAGYKNTSGSYNLFEGYQAGFANKSGSVNSFSGYQAGFANSTGFNNSFYGSYSGYKNTSGIWNSFFGSFAGQNNTNGYFNTFSGFSAGEGNTTGGQNTFLGAHSGSANNTGNSNTAVGNNAGVGTTGSGNSSLGNYAGLKNTTGNNNTYIGDSADATGVNFSNATAIGYNAQVGQSNAIVLGNGARVGIGTSTPKAKLEVNGSIKLDTLAGTGNRMLITDSTGLLKTKALPVDTASNGLSVSGTNIVLGGKLRAATTIQTDTSKTLKFTGIQTGATSDSIMVLSSGVVKKIAVSTAVPTYTGSNGVKVSGSNLSLGGNLSSSTTIGTSSSNTLKLTGVQSGSSTDSLVVMNNGVVKKMNPYTGSNGVTISSNGVRLGGNLSAATTIGTTSSNTLKLTGVQSGTSSDSLVVISSGVIKKVAVSTDVPTYTGSNGVTLSGTDVNLGGNLSSATTIGTSSSNTLKLTGVQTGSSSDSIMVISSGIIKKTANANVSTSSTAAGDVSGTYSTLSVDKIKGTAISSSAPSGGQVLKYNSTTSKWEPNTDNGLTGGSNGISISGSNAVLGGNLSSATTIGTSSSNTLKLTGIQSGSSSDSVMVLSNGVIKKTANTNVSTSATAAGDVSGTYSSLSVDKIKGTSVSSTAPSNKQVLKYNSTTSKWEPATDSATAYTASNGLKVAGTNVTLGGTLTGSTTIGTSSSNTLKLTGIQTGSSSDSIMTLSNGVIKKIDYSSVASNAWSHSGTKTTLSNSGDNVGVGKTPAHAMDVKNGINTDSSYMIKGLQVLSTTGTSMLTIGPYAGKSNTTGYRNVFVGDSAGYNNNTGYENSFLGYQAGLSNTSGNNNSFFGTYTGFHNTTGYFNTMTGVAAGLYNTSGSYNVFSGNQAGLENLTGNNDILIGVYSGFYGHNASNIVAIGSSTLYNNQKSGNTAVGAYSGYNNTNGTSNVFVGDSAGYSNTTGSNIVAEGYMSLFNNTASNNTAVGSYSGYNTTSGFSNTFSGGSSGYNNTLGSGNSFMGYQSGLSNTMGSGNSFIGIRAGYYNTTGSYNNFIGQDAGVFNTTGNYNSCVGVNASAYNSTGSYNVAEGFGALYYNQVNGNTAVGAFSGYNNNYGFWNVFIGDSAGYNNTGGFGNSFVGYQSGLSNTNGVANVFMGYQTGDKNTTGSYNSFYGMQAGYNTTTGSYNNFTGMYAGISNTTGSYNNFNGVLAGYINTIGSNIVADGYSSLYINKKSGNTAVGAYSGYYNTTGSQNVFLGDSSGYNNSTGSGITALGYLAGQTNTTGSRNVFIGDSADANSANLTNATAIGCGAKVSTSNSLILGKNANVGIGKSNPAHGLDVKNSISTDSTIRLTNGADTSVANEIYFADNGQIRSLDNNHRIMFDRSNNVMELREYGDILFSSGSGLIYNGRTQKMTIKASGYIGMGITAPAFPLEVYNTKSDVVRFSNSTGGAGAKASIAFNTYGTTSGVGARITAIDGGSYTGALAFEVNEATTANGSTTTEAMRISNTGNVGIGTTNPNSTFQVTGSIATNRTSFSSSATIASTDHICAVTTTSSITLTLPSASTAGAGREYIIKSEKSTATISIATSSSQTIDGASSKSISTGYGSLRVYSDGSNWFTF